MIQTQLMSTFSEEFAYWKNHKFFAFSSGELKSFPGIIMIKNNGICGNPIKKTLNFFPLNISEKLSVQKKRKDKKTTRLTIKLCNFQHLNHLRGGGGGRGKQTEHWREMG